MASLIQIMKISLISFLFLFFSETSLQANEHIKLFRDYYFGMSKQEIIKPITPPFSNNGEVIVLNTPIKFFSFSWIQAFSFKYDKLFMVSLTLLNKNINPTDLILALEHNHMKHIEGNELETILQNYKEKKIDEFSILFLPLSYSDAFLMARSRAVQLYIKPDATVLLFYIVKNNNILQPDADIEDF